MIQISGEFTVNINWYGSDYQITGTYQADVDAETNHIWELIIKSLTVIAIDGNVVYENLDLYRNDLNIIDGFWFDFAVNYVLKLNRVNITNKAREEFYGT